MNPTWSSGELAHAIKVSGASHILAHPSAMSLVLETLQSMGHSLVEIKSRVIVMAPGSETPAEHKSGGWVGLDGLDYTPVASVPERFDGDAAEATALIYFSSGMLYYIIIFDRSDCGVIGTTGLSKGVELSHRNIVANLAMLSSVYILNGANRDVTITAVPLFHVLGGLYLVMFSLFKGTPVVLLPRFVPEEYLGCVEKYRVSVRTEPLLVLLTALNGRARRSSSLCLRSCFSSRTTRSSTSTTSPRSAFSASAPHPCRPR